MLALLHHCLSSTVFSHTLPQGTGGTPQCHVERQYELPVAVSSYPFNQGPQSQAGALILSLFYTEPCGRWRLVFGPCRDGLNSGILQGGRCTFWSFMPIENIMTSPLPSPDLFSKNAALLRILWGHSKENVSKMYQIHRQAWTSVLYTPTYLSPPYVLTTSIETEFGCALWS